MNAYNTGKNPVLEDSGKVSATLGRGSSIPAPLTFFLALSAVASATVLPLLSAGSDLAVIASWIVCILCGLTVLFTVKRPMMLGLIYVSIFFLLSFTGSPVLPALILGSTVAVGGCAALIRAFKGSRVALTVLMPILSYGITLALLGDPLFACAAFILYLPAIALGVSSRFNAPKTVCIAVAASTTVCVTLVIAALAILSAYGSLSFESVAKAASDLSDAYVTTTETVLTAMGQEVTTPMLRSFRSDADLLINSSIGLLTALCLILSFSAHNVQCRTLAFLGLDEYLTEEQTKLTASTESALVFVGAFILSYTTGASGGTSLIATVGSNLCYILMPLLALMGFEAMQYLIERFFFLGVIAAVGIAVAIFLLSSAASTGVLNLLALVGAFYVLILRADRWAKEYFGKGETNE